MEDGDEYDSSSSAEGEEQVQEDEYCKHEQTYCLVEYQHSVNHRLMF